MVESHIERAEVPFISHAEAARWLFHQLQSLSLPDKKEEEKSIVALEEKDADLAIVGMRVERLRQLRQHLQKTTGSSAQLPEFILPSETRSHESSRDEVAQTIESPQFTFPIVFTILTPQNKRAVAAWQEVFQGPTSEWIELTPKANLQKGSMEYQLHAREKILPISFLDPRIQVSSLSSPAQETQHARTFSQLELAYFWPTLPDAKDLFQWPEDEHFLHVVVGSFADVARTLHVTEGLTSLDLNTSQRQTIGYNPHRFQFYQLAPMGATYGG